MFDDKLVNAKTLVFTAFLHELNKVMNSNIKGKQDAKKSRFFPPKKKSRFFLRSLLIKAFCQLNLVASLIAKQIT